MARVKAPLKMADGTMVSNIDAIKEHFDLENMLGHYESGRLATWLKTFGYEDEAEALDELNVDADDFQKNFCAIFDVSYKSPVDQEKIAEREERLKRLRQYTANENVLRNVDKVAFDQGDLADRLEEGYKEIYLCRTDEYSFRVSASKKGIKYIGVNQPKAHLGGKLSDSLGLEFEGVEVDNLPVTGIHSESDDMLAPRIPNNLVNKILEHPPTKLLRTTNFLLAFYQKRPLGKIVEFLFGEIGETKCGIFSFNIHTLEETKLMEDSKPPFRPIIIGDEILYTEEGDKEEGDKVVCFDVNSNQKTLVPIPQSANGEFSASKELLAYKIFTSEGQKLEIYNRQSHQTYQVDLNGLHDAAYVYPVAFLDDVIYFVCDTYEEYWYALYHYNPKTKSIVLDGEVPKVPFNVNFTAMNMRPIQKCEDFIYLLSDLLYTQHDLAYTQHNICVYDLKQKKTVKNLTFSGDLIQYEDRLIWKEEDEPHAIYQLVFKSGRVEQLTDGCAEYSQIMRFDDRIIYKKPEVDEEGKPKNVYYEINVNAPMKETKLF